MGNYNSTINEKPTTTNAKTIEIIFENKNDEISIGDEVGEYYSHPAFVAFDSNGFWTGKFETTGNVNEVQVKPNKISLRNLNIKNIFELSYYYKRNNDSHMMKNTEWGATSYLSLSIYGINKEININNNRNYLTGYSASLESNQTTYPGTYGNTEDLTLPYNTETGYLASTTGNISGIYDMSGGTYEYVAAYISEYLGNSGFTSDPALIYGNKYFDKYYGINISATSYNKRILGDATGELGPFYYYFDSDENSRNHSSWYNDVSHFVGYSRPWFHRGGDYANGILSGQGYFNRDTGVSYGGVGFRLVLKY
jgi:hypothetical protein